MTLSFRKNRDSFAIFSLMLFLFSLIMFYVRDNSDLWAHANIAQRMLYEDGLFKTNFLMYLCANILSGFSGDIVAIRIAIVVLISSAETAKFYIVKRIFMNFSGTKEASICSFSLLLVYIIPLLCFLKIFGIFTNTHNMYLSYCVPNVWHNSTIICSMPFAIVSYWLSLKQLVQYEGKRCLWITLFLGLSVLVKPSFFFVYAVAYPLATALKYGFGKQLLNGVTPILICSMLLAYEYLTIWGGRIQIIT